MWLPFRWSGASIIITLGSPREFVAADEVLRRAMCSSLTCVRVSYQDTLTAATETALTPRRTLKRENRSIEFMEGTAFFQSNSRASAAIENRVALSVRRGVCSRSIKNVSCFRRKRFSAARAPRERRRFRANARASRTTGTIFESKRKNGPFRIKGDESDDGHRETADSGRSKLRNQRRIEFLRTSASS